MTKRAIWVDERWPLPARRLQTLVQQMLKITHQQAERVIHGGGVRVNGQVARRAQLVVQLGDRVEAELDATTITPADSGKTRNRFQPLEIVFQDQFLVVVNKPPALLTVPTPHRERNTLISLLEKRMQHDGTGERAYCVHRLDRGVSGLLVFGKSLEMAEAMRDQFEARKPHRSYVALVLGRLVDRRGTFRSYLATDENLNRYSTGKSDDGELAVTHYDVMKSCDEITMVAVRLETGRRNQIRVHFAEAGHPVLGDERYGGRSVDVQRFWPYRRLALHAATLGFEHPIHHKPLKFHSTLPPEMASCERKFGVDRAPTPIVRHKKRR